jgi:aspartyl-tRNA(Asn)/glutamyl-tRNA(Gln) amidotransferase subunit C
MPVDRATVLKIADLARIDVPEADLDRLAVELNNIIGWVESLGEVDTRGVAPMASPVDLKLRWRKDFVTDGGVPEKIVANAPEEIGGMFAVPKVVE